MERRPACRRSGDGGGCLLDVVVDRWMLLATPLTVWCSGRWQAYSAAFPSEHSAGEEPVFEPKKQVYQRLLAATWKRRRN